MSDLRNAHLYNFGGGLTEWGKKNRTLRARKNTDLMRMAEFLGVSIGYLSAIECGRKPKEPGFMKRCEDYLNSLPDDELQMQEYEEINKGIRAILEHERRCMIYYFFPVEDKGNQK